MAKKVKTKQRILDASLKLFMKYGFHGTTFQQIADEVGITQPGVFIHFKNKLELFSALRTEVALSNREYVDSKINIHDNALQSLQKHCQLNFEWIVHNPDKSQLIILLYHFACFDPKMQELNHQVLEAGEKRVLQYLVAGKRENLFTLRDENAKAREIHSFIIGQSIKYLSLKKPPSRPQIERETNAFLKTILEIK